jgi:nitrous oxidase accessory protein NosD
MLKNNNRGLFSSYSTKNTIEENNFIGNDEQAKFTKLLRRGFLSPNNWKSNYWEDWKGIFIKPIPGLFYIPNRLIFGLFIPWFEFDLSPSSESFDI